MRVRVELHLAIVAVEVDVGHVLPSTLVRSLKCVFSFHDTGPRRIQVLNFMRDKLCALLTQPVPKENTEYPSFAAYALRIRGREDSDACASDKRFRRPASVNADS